MMIARLYENEKGSVAFEYLAILVLVGMFVVLAVAPLLGPAVAEEYVLRPKQLLSHHP